MSSILRRSVHYQRRSSFVSSLFFQGIQLLRDWRLIYLFFFQNRSRFIHRVHATLCSMSNCSEEMPCPRFLYRAI